MNDVIAGGDEDAALVGTAGSVIPCHTREHDVPSRGGFG
jgi:hypothetical protein